MYCKYVSRTNFRTFCSKEGPPIDPRGEQTRGAMKSFFKNVTSSSTGTKTSASSISLWSKLRKEVDADSTRNRTEITKEGFNLPESYSSKQRYFRPSLKGRGIGKGKSDIPKSVRKEFESANESDEIPPALKSVLFEFDGVDIAGKQVNTRGMDDIDTFLANTYYDSLKTINNEVRSIMVLKDTKRIRIPRGRSISQLLKSLHPSRLQDEYGQILADLAWKRLVNNVYFTEDTKFYMHKQIAVQTNGYLAVPDSPLANDLIFTRDFRKGILFIEEEKRRSDNKEHVQSESFSQADTDWDEIAVVDEDQL